MCGCIVGGKTYAQRYHHNPANLQARPDLSPILEQYMLEALSEEQHRQPSHGIPPLIYPLSAMRNPKRVVRKVWESHPQWMFPTLLFRSERFLKTVPKLPSLGVFITGLCTYGTLEDVYDAIYTVGQRLLQLNQPMFMAPELWHAVLLDYSKLGFGNYSANPPTLFDWKRGNDTESSREKGVYLKMDYHRAFRYSRVWLPLLTEITARQLARQILWSDARAQSEQRVPEIVRKSNPYALLTRWDHMASALCFPAVGSRVRELLESLGEPEVVDYYDTEIVPACQQHRSWAPDAGALYDRMLRNSR